MRVSDYDFNETEFSGNRRRQPSRKKGMGVLLATFITGGVVIVLCCGGGTAIVVFAMNVISREIEVELRDHPQLVKHVGPVTSFDMNWTATFAADEDVYVFDVRGEKGSGEVTVESITGLDDKEEIQWARLRLPGGEVVDLVEEN